MSKYLRLMGTLEHRYSGKLLACDVFAYEYTSDTGHAADWLVAEFPLYPGITVSLEAIDVGKIPAMLIDADRKVLAAVKKISGTAYYVRRPEKKFDPIDYLSCGYNIDEELLFCFLPDLVPLSLDTPPTWQQYVGNEIIVTNSKTGKTELSKRTGRCLNRSSVSGLLGFSTADEILKGSLYHQYHAFSLDELEKEKKFDAYTDLFNIMENGEAEIHLGRGPFVLDTRAPIRIMANPPEPMMGGNGRISEGVPLSSSFEQIISRFSFNYHGLPTRIAIVCVNDKMGEANGKNYSTEVFSEMRAAFSWYAHEKSKELAKAFDVHNDWLNQPYLPDFVSALKKIAVSVEIPPVRQFLLGFPNGSKHARGAALRIALHNAKVGDDALLAIAEQAFKKICSISLKSFSRIATGLEEVSYFKTVQREVISSNLELKSLLLLFLENENGWLRDLAGKMPSQFKLTLSGPAYAQRLRARYFSQFSDVGLVLRGFSPDDWRLQYLNKPFFDEVIGNELRSGGVRA